MTDRPILTPAQLAAAFAANDARLRDGLAKLATDIRSGEAERRMAERKSEEPVKQ